MLQQAEDAELAPGLGRGLSEAGTIHPVLRDVAKSVSASRYDDDPMKPLTGDDLCRCGTGHSRPPRLEQRFAKTGQLGGAHVSFRSGSRDVRASHALTSRESPSRMPHWCWCSRHLSKLPRKTLRSDGESWRSRAQGLNST